MKLIRRTLTLIVSIVLLSIRREKTPTSTIRKL